MRFIEIYAVVATVITVGVTIFFGRLLRRPGPQRGFGAGQALLVVVAGIGIAWIHGSTVCVVAMCIAPSPLLWACSGLHGALLVAGLVLSHFK
jgi:hypothetical protein